MGKLTVDRFFTIWSKIHLYILLVFVSVVPVKGQFSREYGNFLNPVVGVAGDDGFNYDGSLFIMPQMIPPPLRVWPSKPILYPRCDGYLNAGQLVLTGLGRNEGYNWMPGNSLDDMGSIEEEIPLRQPFKGYPNLDRPPISISDYITHRNFIRRRPPDQDPYTNSLKNNEESFYLNPGMTPKPSSNPKWGNELSFPQKTPHSKKDLFDVISTKMKLFSPHQQNPPGNKKKGGINITSSFKRVISLPSDREIKPSLKDCTYPPFYQFEVTNEGETNKPGEKGSDKGSHGKQLDVDEFQVLDEVSTTNTPHEFLFNSKSIKNGTCLSEFSTKSSMIYQRENKMEALLKKPLPVFEFQVGSVMDSKTTERDRTTPNSIPQMLSEIESALEKIFESQPTACPKEKIKNSASSGTAKTGYKVANFIIPMISAPSTRTLEVKSETLSTTTSSYKELLINLKTPSNCETTYSSRTCSSERDPPTTVSTTTSPDKILKNIIEERQNLLMSWILLEVLGNIVSSLPSSIKHMEIPALSGPTSELGAKSSVKGDVAPNQSMESMMGLMAKEFLKFKTDKQKKGKPVSENVYNCKELNENEFSYGQPNKEYEVHANFPLHRTTPSINGFWEYLGLIKNLKPEEAELDDATNRPSTSFSPVFNTKLDPSICPLNRQRKTSGKGYLICPSCRKGFFICLDPKNPSHLITQNLPD